MDSYLCQSRVFWQRVLYTFESTYPEAPTFILKGRYRWSGKIFGYCLLRELARANTRNIERIRKGQTYRFFLYQVQSQATMRYLKEVKQRNQLSSLYSARLLRPWKWYRATRPSAGQDHQMRPYFRVALKSWNNVLAASEGERIYRVCWNAWSK